MNSDTLVVSEQQIIEAFRAEVAQLSQDKIYWRAAAIQFKQQLEQASLQLLEAQEKIERLQTPDESTDDENES